MLLLLLMLLPLLPLPEILTSSLPIAQAVAKTEITPRKMVIGLRKAARKGYVYIICCGRGFLVKGRVNQEKMRGGERMELTTRS